MVVYVDNQTIGKDVWFDNVQVLHYNTRVIEENHYYPFGLTVSASAMGMTEQPLKYNGKKLEKSFGLEMYDFTARMYDPQLGRTWQPDPLAEMRSWTAPYSWVQNNPIFRIDPSGAIDDIYLTGPESQAALNELQSQCHYCCRKPGNQSKYFSTCR
ncbi:MAG: RHS repeat-associated core domain-containing protein [Flavobacteriales bacterium]|nr:MAG: RHS repeat-associated core domain-containing protein [Flavobacteriales bacterium]